jgi:hypothetical protein
LTASARTVFDLAPYALAFLAAFVLPRRQGGVERFGLGIVAVLTVLMVRGLWPSPAEAPEGGEWEHLLDLIVFIPLLGAAL